MKKAFFCLWILVFLCYSIFCQEYPDNAENFDQQWVDLVIKAYKGLMVGLDHTTADMLFEAAEAMPQKNWEMYLISATLYAPNNMGERALQAIEKAVIHGCTDLDLIKSLSPLKPLHGTTAWKSLLQKTEEKIAAEKNKIENPELLGLLTDLWEKDQQALATYNQQLERLDSVSKVEQGTALFEPVQERWDSNKKQLDSIIDQYGWPGYRLVGKSGTKIAWAIAQHHPDIFFKEKCLALIWEAAKNGDTDINFFAELSDRIARDTWQKQQYGASFGNGFIYPIDAPHLVNARRYALGLAEPVEVYAIYHGVEYTSPQWEESIKISKLNNKQAQNHFTTFKDLLGKGKMDDALAELKKAIEFYGDLTDFQLYNAASALAQTNSKKAMKMSLTILEVLIYRHSESVENIKADIGLMNLHNQPKWPELLKRAISE